MKLLNDFRDHLKFRLDHTKLVELVEFYFFGMFTVLLLHIFMQMIPEVGIKIRSINVQIDWILALSVSLLFLFWKLNKLSTKAVYCIRIGLFIGISLALISSIVTYISILLPATINEILLKLVPILIYIACYMIIYLLEDKYQVKIGLTVVPAVLLVFIVSQFKSFGLYLVAYFVLPISILMNIYFIITLIYVTRNELGMNKCHD
ncbi:MAG: hypothetical protein KA902_04715 [Arenimonas sp.]|nr:hypothetical protein [Arenimonas sp.]